MFHTFFRRLRGLLDASRSVDLAPTHVRRLERADDRLSGEVTLIERLSDGDCILCVAGEVVPCDGIVIDGSAGTGIGSPVIAGTTVLSNLVIVRVGETSIVAYGRKTSGPTSCSRAPATSRGSSRTRRVKSL